MKKILNTKLHLRFVFNPLIRLMADNLGAECCINKKPRKHPVIVSLTSYEERFDDLVISLYSIFRQTLKPDRIILWLSDEFKSLNDLPYEITGFLKNGLEICFVNDISSNTKVSNAFR